jgi:hypothetical protein
MGCGSSSDGGVGQDTITVSSSGKKRDAYKLVLLGDKAVGKSRCVAVQCGVLAAVLTERGALSPATALRSAHGAQRLSTLARAPQSARRVANIRASPHRPRSPRPAPRPSLDLLPSASNRRARALTALSH